MVFEFVFERRACVERFLGALQTSVPAVLVILRAPLEVVTARESARSGRRPLGERVAACWRTMAPHLSELGMIIDASRPIDEVVALVEAVMFVS